MMSNHTGAPRGTALRAARLSRLIAALVLTAGAAGAQSPSGFRVGTSLAAGVPQVSDGSAEAWSGFSEFDVGAGLGFTLGYDARHLGASVGLELAEARAGGRDGASVTMVAVAHWLPPARLAGWRPTLTVGYVRQALGSVDVAPNELPSSVFMGRADPNDPNPAKLSLLGNGVRLGASAERMLTGRAAIVVEASSDLLRFNSASYDGDEFPMHGTGWSFSPRLGVGLRWWPLR
jgi:hypothetical protein